MAAGHNHHVLDLCLFLTTAMVLLQNTMAYPLSTNSRWIVNEGGQRVKLACVNWPSHLQPVVAEGLSQQPVTEIANRIVAMKFNCVRLTWPLELAINDTLANSVTVRQSFQSLGLNDDIDGIQRKNPNFIDLPLIEALKTVVNVLGQKGVMVILDNHLTVPGWCCSAGDGNGFFGDRFFDPTAWINGWKKMAGIFNGVSNVIGMSLRNELRGRKQNVNDWYTYMQQGAEAIHSVNPNVLVIMSGLGFDTDLSFVQNRPVSLSFAGKLVFELHWYSWYGGIDWGAGNACGKFRDKVKWKAGFLLDKGFPLFVSEFGIDQTTTSDKEKSYIDCFLGWMAETDVDWALWALTGSYYLRDGARRADEHFGALTTDWILARNPYFLARLPFRARSALRGK
ncbi:PREDICTED: uncharacterized protein LOC104810759 [Tarenaya hassleriana]|uniref:uncharacterized protein LOC104810759 n=1 Tax=Tarenaya hassleriana TaxID=28532 RepID=UPI00053C4099|nr:PREDICTED: uncharacterized protein LOC104810759 [Tarenaya hassleriana]